jgi:poly(A) polymerase Pap1
MSNTADAIVPLIRLTIYGVQIDLLLSIISQDFLRKNPDFFEAEAT